MLWPFEFDCRKCHPVFTKQCKPSKVGESQAGAILHCNPGDYRNYVWKELGFPKYSFFFFFLSIKQGFLCIPGFHCSAQDLSLAHGRLRRVLHSSRGMVPGPLPPFGNCPASTQNVIKEDGCNRGRTVWDQVYPSWSFEIHYSEPSLRECHG